MDRPRPDRTIAEDARASAPAPAEPSSFDIEFPVPAVRIAASPGAPWDEETGPGRIRGRRPPVLDERLVSLVAPTSFEAEQYRMLRYRVEQRHKDAGLQLLAITSPAGGDGKTTTAINLAGALAQSRDARVLLLEADLRRPSFMRLFGMQGSGSPGLVEASLNPRACLRDVVRIRQRFNLAFVPSGRPPLSPYEVLKSGRLEELLAEARRSYDYVVLDTPPVVPCPDFQLIERWVDGALLVVAAHRTRRSLVDQALRQMDPSRTLGLVFNGDDSAEAEYHYSSRSGSRHRGASLVSRSAEGR